jgi:hypothetical protein
MDEIEEASGSPYCFLNNVAGVKPFGTWSCYHDSQSVVCTYAKSTSSQLL